MEVKMIEVPVGAGLTHRNPFPSKIWVKLMTFATKREATDWAKTHGFRVSDVVKRYGRFEWAWCIDGGLSIVGRQVAS